MWTYSTNHSGTLPDMRPISSIPGRWSGRDGSGPGAPIHGAFAADDPDRTLDLPTATAAFDPTTVVMPPAAGTDNAQAAPPPERHIGVVVTLPTLKAENPALPMVDPGPAIFGSEAPQPVPQASQSNSVEVGTVLRDRYRLTDQIGGGGFSVIFEATDLHRRDDASSASQVAIKVLKPEFRASADAVGRLKREFARLQLLSHPAISRARALDHDGEIWFLVLDHVDGKPLSTLLSRYPHRSMGLDQALKIIRDSGEALDFAHRHGIVHCDFKPGNILVTDEDDIRVIDFGAAFDQSSPTGTGDDGRTDSRQATPAYASPERLSGAPPDIRDDVFSFAAVVYELLAGRRLQGNDPVAANAGVPITPPRPPGLTELQWNRLSESLSPLRDGRLDSLRPLLDAFAPSAIRSGKWMLATRVALLSVALVLAGATLYRTFSTPPGTRARVSATASNAAEASARQGALKTESPAPPAIAATAALLPVTPAAAPTPAVTRPRAPGPQVSSITLDQADLRVAHLTAMAAMIVQRTAGPERRVRLLWRTVAGTALPGIDYSPVEAGSLQLADNQDTSSLYVPLLRRDNVSADRTFYIELSSNDPVVSVGPVSRVAVTIIGQADPAGTRSGDLVE